MNKKLQCAALLIVVTLNLMPLSLIMPGAIAGSSSTSPISSSTIQNNVAGFVSNEAAMKNNPARTDDRSDKWNFSNPNQWIKIAYGNSSTTRVIVGLDDGNASGLSKLGEIAAEYSAKIVDTVSIKGKPIAAVVELAVESVSRFVEETRSSGLADYVEPNLKLQASMVPNDPYWNVQWSPQKIEADWAWNATTGSSSVLVAVIDTGIDYTHPDLAANYVPLGYNWAYNTSDVRDDFGHGTHCAGIIAAAINNGIGIAGLAQVKLMSEKVLDSQGGGYVDWFAHGVINATDAGAKILSISLGGYGDSQLMHESLKYAYNAGVLIVAAAANDNSDMKPYPAGYSEVVAIAATDPSDQKADFSNYGDWIELAAPGVQVYSTTPTYPCTLTQYGYNMNYDYLSGTSMACPHAAGVAALIWSRYPGKSRDWVRLWLRYTADDLGDSGFDIYYGYGRVNARKAVETSSVQHELIISDFAMPPYVKPGTQGTLNVTVLNFGETDETNVTVQLWANSTLTSYQNMDYLGSGNLTTESLPWTPSLEGLYNVTVNVVPVPGETSVANNVVSRNVLVGNPIKAVVLHSYGNVLGQIIVNWQELNNEWHLFGDRMIYIDYTSLNKDNITYADLAASEADVLIISCACYSSSGWEFKDSEIAAITRYVFEGHGLIVTAGTLYYDVPNNNQLGALLGIDETFSWTATSTDLLELVNATHPIFSGVPNPMVFLSVGTTLPPDGLWDSNELVGGKYLARGHFKESAIVEHRGLLFIAPWLEVIPPYYKCHLQLLYNAIVWSRYQKPQHDLVAGLETPPHVLHNEAVTLNATVDNVGVNDETNVRMDLLIDDNVVSSGTITQLPNGSTYVMPFAWQPTTEKSYNITVYVHPVSFEESTFNNVVTKSVYVSRVKHVLLDLAHFNDPMDEYRTWTESLAESNYVIDILGSAPVTLSVLRKYDVFVTINPYAAYDDSELSAVQCYVEGGGGLLVVGEHAMDVTSSLTGFAGITWIPGGGMSGTTTDITPHPVTRRVSQVYVESPQGVLNVDSPAQDLVRDVDHEPMLAVSEQMYGKVLCFVDEDSLMNSAITQADNLLLANNMLDWLSTVNRPEHELAVELDAPSFLEFNSSTLLNATVLNVGMENEIDVMISLFINDSEVASETLPILASGEQHTINYAWTLPSRGIYNITAYAPLVVGENRTDNNAETVISSVFFYTHSTMPSEWVKGGIAMNWHADDNSWQYVLPFSFPFYGLSFHSIYVSSNGLITFDGPDSTYQNGIPKLASRLAIAPAWGDWKTDTPYDIFIWHSATHAGIRWYVSAYGTGGVANFEVVLGEDGLIQLNYGSTSGQIPTVTVGISNGAGHIVAENLGDLNNITTRIFVPYVRNVAVYSVTSSPNQVFSGQSVNVTATVGNRGDKPEDFDVQVYYENLTLNSNVPLYTINPYSTPNEPHQGSSVWIEPSNLSLAGLSIGDTFNITLWANTTTTSYAWQIDVAYNSTRLNTARAGYTGGMQSDFFSNQSTVPLTPSFRSANSTHSIVIIGESLQGDEERQPGFGSLCWIEFRILQDPNLSFTDYFELDPTDTYVLDPDLNTMFMTLFGGAYGSYTISPPPPPPSMIDQEEVHLDPGSNATLNFTWNTLGLSLGEYDVKAVAVPLPGETDLGDNTLTGGAVEILWRHDVAVVNVTASRPWVYKGQNVTVNVTVTNIGNAAENVTVLIYFNVSSNEVVGTGTTKNLLQGENRTMTIQLNSTGVADGYTYNLTTVAMIAGSDYNPSDNTFNGPTVTVRFLGDFNGDGKVDVRDIAPLAKAFGSKLGDLNWNPNVDLNFDGKIDVKDIAICARNFGKQR